jgi:hypothetical protein
MIEATNRRESLDCPLAPRKSDPTAFGLAKNLPCPFRKFVNEDLGNLAELSAPEDSDWQAREAA